MENTNELVARYINLWNEPDPDVRRKLIQEVWAPDGGQVLVDAPLEARDAARQISFPPPHLEVRGYDMLEARVTRAHQMFVEPGEYLFTLDQPPTELLPGLVTFRWAMTSRADGQVAGRGVDVFRLDRDGRVRSAFQFIEG